MDRYKNPKITNFSPLWMADLKNIQSSYITISLDLFQFRTRDTFSALHIEKSSNMAKIWQNMKDGLVRRAFNSYLHDNVGTRIPVFSIDLIQIKDFGNSQYIWNRLVLCIGR